jgi:hypothetical protein
MTNFVEQSRLLPEKLTVSQLFKKFPSFYGTVGMQMIEITGQPEKAARSDALYKTLSKMFTGVEYLTKA